MRSIEIHSMEEFRFIVHELQERVQQSYAFLHRAAQAGVSPGEIEQEIENAQKNSGAKQGGERVDREVPTWAATASSSTSPSSSCTGRGWLIFDMRVSS